jgi:CheY-like chemotaxis protein
MAEESYVLVVDDEHIIADTLCMILKSQGYAAVPAYSGEEALSYVAQHPPRMLISDVIMSGGMTGFDLAIQLKGKLPDCKILLISGQVATEKLLDVAKEAGFFFDLLTKPAHPEEVLPRVREAFVTSPFSKEHART